MMLQTHSQSFVIADLHSESGIQFVIIVQMSGGLGNQLFQYATGKALAVRTRQPLVIDDRVFHEDKFRSFCLPLFVAEFTLAQNCPDAAVILPPSRRRWAAFLLWRWTRGRKLKYLRERSMRFDATVLDSGHHVYLHGYWQSEEYFRDVAAVIREELSLRLPPSGENAEWLSEISAGNSVSIHVRRGDYVSDPKAGRVHGTCSLEYYRRATEEMTRRTSREPTFYVFSDDPQWVADHLRLPFPTRYVSHNDDSHNYEDLRLMTACRHHIVANSSFSWWGAWLGGNPDRIVIAPKTWFNDPSRSDRSLVPAEWVRL